MQPHHAESLHANANTTVEKRITTDPIILAAAFTGEERGGAVGAKLLHTSSATTRTKTFCILMELC